MPSRAYGLIITRTARKELIDLPLRISEQTERTIDRILARLNEGQRPQDMKRLHGRPDTDRVDTGEYRILFELNDQARTITIFRVRHRRDVYRNL